MVIGPSGEHVAPGCGCRHDKFSPTDQYYEALRAPAPSISISALTGDISTNYPRELHKSALCHVCRLGSSCTHAAKPRPPWVCPVDDWDLLPDV